jgi:hypothetical protein
VKYKSIYYNVPPQEIAKNTAKSLIQLKPPLQKWLELSNSGALNAVTVLPAKRGALGLGIG